MPHETKEQRQAREAAEKAAREAQERQEYFPRVMKVLARATNLYWDIQVPDEKKFVLLDTNRTEQYTFPVAYDAREEWRLEVAERAVSAAEEAQAEARRKIEIRNQALSKLSQEERQALGL